MTGHPGVAVELLEGRVRAGAQHDRVDHPAEDLGRVLDRLAAAELHVAGREHHARAAQPRDAAGERDARAGGGPLEDQRDHPARRAAAASPPPARAFRRSARSRMAATASGEWWRSVSSERPARAGCGVKAGQDTAAQCTPRARAGFRPSPPLGSRAGQRPAEAQDTKVAVSEAEDGARAEQPAASAPSSSRVAIAVPVAPGARRRHARPGRSSRCRSRLALPLGGARGMAAAASRAPGSRAPSVSGRPGADGAAMADRHRGVRPRPALAVGAGHRAQDARRRAHRQPVAHGPPDRASTTTPSSPTRSRGSAAAPSATACRCRWSCSTSTASRPSTTATATTPATACWRRWARPSAPARAPPTSPARFGGEEFALIVPGPAEEAMEAAERIRAAVAEVRVLVAGRRGDGHHDLRGRRRLPERRRRPRRRAHAATGPTRRSTARRPRGATGSAFTRPSTAGPPPRRTAGRLPLLDRADQPGGDVREGGGQREQSEHPVEGDQIAVAHEEVRRLPVEQEAERPPTPRGARPPPSGSAAPARG